MLRLALRNNEMAPDEKARPLDLVGAMVAILLIGLLSIAAKADEPSFGAGPANSPAGAADQVVRPPPLASPPPAPANENEKSAIFQRYANAFTMTSLMAQNAKPSKSFCQGFLRDLADARNIKFVEPIIKAVSYEEPALQAFLRPCAGAAINKDTIIDRNIIGNNVESKNIYNIRDLTKDKNGNYEVVEYSTANFRVYDVGKLYEGELHASGPQFLFYGERECRLFDSICGGSINYKILSFPDADKKNGKCLVDKYAAIVDERYEYQKGGEIVKKVGENALIQYAGKYAILSAQILPNSPSIGNMSIVTPRHISGKSERGDIFCLFNQYKPVGNYPLDVVKR